MLNVVNRHLGLKNNVSGTSYPELFVLLTEQMTNKSGEPEQSTFFVFCFDKSRHETNKLNEDEKLY